MPKMTYALRDDCLIHVSEVSSGLSCNCICPSCGGQLVAKKGAVQHHHFAHYNAEECKTGYETSLHLLAKSILSENKKILLPAVFVFESDPKWKIADEMLTSFDHVDVEVNQGDIIPDLVGYVSDRKLLIEVRVTHAVDENKKSKIIQRGTSCIEIDLSNFEGEITKEDLAKFLMSDSSRLKWIYNAHTIKYQIALSLFQEKIWLIYRGFALHAETCPIPARTWKGIAYANFFEDCSNCSFLRDYQTSEPDKSKHVGHILCSGKFNVGCIDDLKQELTK